MGSLEVQHIWGESASKPCGDAPCFRRPSARPPSVRVSVQTRLGEDANVPSVALRCAVSNCSPPPADGAVPRLDRRILPRAGAVRRRRHHHRAHRAIRRDAESALCHSLARAWGRYLCRARGGWARAKYSAANGGLHVLPRGVTPRLAASYIRLNWAKCRFVCVCTAAPYAALQRRDWCITVKTRPPPRQRRPGPTVGRRY